VCFEETNPSLRRTVFNFKLLLPAKIRVHNPYQHKVVWSESGEKSAQIKHHFDFDVSRQVVDFSLEEALLWIINRQFDVKMPK